MLDFVEHARKTAEGLGTRLGSVDFKKNRDGVALSTLAEGRGDNGDITMYHALYCPVL